MADRKRGSQIEVCPNRRVIGRIFAFSKLAIDSRSGAFLREAFARKHGVNPESAIFWERKHPIIPPGENSRRLRMQSQRVAQPDLAKFLKRRAFTLRAHDRAAPKLRIVNIDIFGRDVEVAADDKIDIALFCQAIAKSRVPFELVSIRR